MAINWYAIRTRPGSQRPVKSGYSGDRFVEDETIIERNLRHAGFDGFMPATYREIRHHRTDEYITKRYPLMVGYMFVRNPASFYKLKDVVGVSDILGVAGSPMAISEATISAIRDAEEREIEILERRRAARLQKERKLCRKLTRKEARELFPANKRIIVSSEGYLSGMAGVIVDATGRNTIKAVINTLNGLVPVELGLEDFREAV